MPQLIETVFYKDSTKIPLPINPFSNNSPDDIFPYNQQSTEAWAASQLSYANLVFFRPETKYYKTPVVNSTSANALTERWSEAINSLTQLSFRTNSNEINDLIQILKITQFISCREILANRLINLFHDAIEEDPLSIGINIDSLRYFYKFLYSNSKLKCPIITLTPESDIYLTWREGNQNSLSIHFLPDGHTHFVVFMPNKKYTEQTDYFAGITTYDILMNNIESIGINDLILE